MRRDEIVFTILLAVAIVALTVALLFFDQRGRQGMYDEGCVIGKVLAIEPAQDPRAPDLLIVEDRSREKYPNRIACEFFGDKVRNLLVGIEPGQLVRVVGSIKSNQSQQGKWFTHFSAFSLSPLDAYGERQAQALGIAPAKLRTVPPSYTEPAKSREVGADDDLAF